MRDEVAGRIAAEDYDFRLAPPSRSVTRRSTSATIAAISRLIGGLETEIGNRVTDICQSSPDSWLTRAAPDAATGRADRTLLRASVRHRWDAPHAFAWPPQYPQAVADSCRGLQSRARQMRHLLGSGTPRGLQDRQATVLAALLVLLRAPRRWLVVIFPHHTHSSPLCVAFPSPITTTG